MIIYSSIILILLISIPSTASQSPTTTTTNKTVDEQDACALAQSRQQPTTIRVVVLFDITPEYGTNFRSQQHRLIKTLRHIDQRAKGQPRFYALVAFHRTSVVLSGLNYAHAKNVEKIIVEISGLNPRRRLETAPSKAFETADELFEYHQTLNTSGTTNIVLLIHDGLNTDLRNETFEAIAKLSKHETGIFAIAGSIKPNEQILSEYTGLRSNVFANNDDMEPFFQAIDNKIDPCAATSPTTAELVKSKFPTPTKLRDDKNRSAVEVLILAENEQNNWPKKSDKVTPTPEQQQFAKREQSFLSKDFKLECDNIGKVDLMLVVDTSGSMYLSFDQQRQQALQLLHAIEPALHSMQVGVIQFAHEPTVIHSLREPTVTKYHELLNRVRDIVFTGRNTRIADALELALNEFDRHGRKDAQKVLILISDGHGQEFWHRAAEVAHRLEKTPDMQRFAVSTSLDYNLEELILYMGDSRRVFVGQRTFSFMPAIIAFLNKCLPNSVKKLTATGGTTTIADDNGTTKRMDTELSEEKSTVETTTTITVAVDEFTTVANLSLMMREADNKNNNAPPVDGDVTLSQNTTAPTSLLSAVGQANSNLAQQNATTADDDDGMLAAVGKRDKLDEDKHETLSSDNKRDQQQQPQHLAGGEAEKNDDDDAVGKTERVEETLRKIVPDQIKVSNTEESAECDTDVLIILDRSRPDQAFEQQIALAKHLVSKIEPEAISSGKTRVAIIAFGTEATKEAAWDQKLTRRQILQKLDTIRNFNGQTSFVQAVKLAVQEISKTRRPETRMLTTVFWSGLDDKEQPEELTNAINEFNAINRTQLFAVSLNPKANLTRLKELATDHWHVFVEGRTNQFVGQASQYLVECVLPSSGSLLHRNPSSSNNDNEEPGELDNHEPLTSVERVEHLQAAARAFQRQPLGSCKDDLVDLALLIHFRPQNGSSSNEISGQFQAMRRAGMDALRQAPADHYLKRIRLSLLINAQVQVSLKTAIDLDDAMFALDRAQLEQAERDATVPLADKLQMSLDDLRKFHRDGARVVLLVLSNDEQQRLNTDEQQSRLIIKGLDRLSASLFILHFAPRDAPAPDGTLSAQFNGTDTERTIRVFSTRGKISQFVDEFRRKTFTCRKRNEQQQPPVIDSKLASPREEELVASDSALPPSEDSKAIIASSSSDSQSGNETDNNTSSGAVKLLENVADLDNNSNSSTPTEQLNVKLRATNVSDSQTTLDTVPEGSANQILSSDLNGTAGIATNNAITTATTTEIRPDDETVTVTTTTTIAQHPIMRKKIKFEMSQDEHPRVFLLGDECKVDLMFIIDTSQSVQEAFDEQLQFAVDLVKRLPDQDFAQRVQVGVVSFNKKAQVQFGLGQLKEKAAILKALLEIKHTGGGTSVVNGVNLAMDEVVKNRRKGTRLMVVLVSDGSSQDPWADVLRSADRLRAAEADVYAVTVSHDYFFRELELYAGNKWFVYIDARIRQFLDEAEMSLVECKSPTMPSQREARDENNGTSSSSLPSAASLVPSGMLVNSGGNMTTAPTNASSSAVSRTTGGSCDKDPVDLMFIIDTSSSVQKEFYAEKNFALDLVRVLPEEDFSKRISIAMIKFRGTADIHFHFHPGRAREDIIYDIERVEHTGGETSLATAAELAFREIFRLRRPDARLIVVIITDGNSQDEWKSVKESAKKLRDTTSGGNGVYAITLSDKYSAEELREYTGTENNLYTNSRIDQFIQEVGNLISRCPEDRERDGVKVTPVPDVEASTTPSRRTMPIEMLLHNSTTVKQQEKNHSAKAKIGVVQLTKPKSEDELAKARDENPIKASREAELLFDEARGTELLSKCNFSKMDMIIILDASTSRENVFEHQRELALSLIERLPISRVDPRVATGIISFTNNAVLRQTLGVGRDRKAVRKAIEDIQYRGGSTLTSKAVELALQDLRRGMRKDARQVVVLMNDGMSQDPWEQVLESSQHLANSGADRFSVAFGSEVDLRELRLYIGNDDRIYRDGSTERFLADIVALLGGGDCAATPNAAKAANAKALKTDIAARVEAVPIHRDQMPNISSPDFAERQAIDFEFQLDSHCEKPNVDLLIMLDNVISSERNIDNLKMNSNRYLLLDVLGSLPADGRVRVALISAGGPRLEYRLEDAQDRDAVATRVERVRPLNGSPDYAAAIARALDHYASSRRDDARGILLLVGNGNGTAELPAQRQAIVNRINQANGLYCVAIDSGKEVNMQTLTEYTGSAQRVFPFDRNAEFSKILFDEATASDQCQMKREDQTVPRSFSELGKQMSGKHDENGSTMNDFSLGPQRLRDIGLVRLDKHTFDNDNLLGNKHDFLKRDDEDSLSRQLSTLTHHLENENILSSRFRFEDRTNCHNSTSSLSKNDKNCYQIGTPSSTSASQQLSSNKQSFRSTSTTTTTESTPEPIITPAVVGEEFPFAFNRLHRIRVQKQHEQSYKNDERRTTTTSSASSTATASLPTTSADTIEPPFRPGCLIDLLLIIDASGSVHAAFEQEKALAAQIVQQIRVGPDNARVAIVKFASAGKVRTLHAFDSTQHTKTVLDVISNMTFSDGTTAIHSALQQAVLAYSTVRGARPGVAEPIAVVFTDGFGQREFSEQAALLRHLVPRVYALAVHDAVRAAIARAELAKITGDARRVFTAATLHNFYNELRERFRGC